MLGGLLLAPVLIVHILIEHLIIVHILVEHLMYAWWVITCPCSVHILVEHLCMLGGLGRTSDVCLVGYYLPLF